MSTADSGPPDLHELNYSRHICEEVLAWPARGNLELIGDCIRSISKTKRITLVKAHGYLERAIRLAKAQGITVDHFFFSQGKYCDVRPAKIEGVVPYKPQDWKEVMKHQDSPEFKAAWDEMQRKCSEIFKIPVRKP